MSSVRAMRIVGLLLCLLSAALVIVTVVLVAGAYAVQVEPADRKTDRLTVTYVEQVAPGKQYVELSNGAAYRLRACEYEDSRGCYWNAAKAGFGGGDSLVSVHVAGRGQCVLYINAPSKNYCTKGDR